MGELIGSLYSSLFEDFFGIELADYLWGQTTVDGRNLYVGIFIWLFFISLFVALLFYYIINHPKLNNWWGWLIFVGINAIINFVWGWQWTQTDLVAGKMVEYDVQTGQNVALDITTSNCLCFGVSNAILSLIMFFILSMIIKWGSTNASHAPF